MTCSVHLRVVPRPMAKTSWRSSSTSDLQSRRLQLGLQYVSFSARGTICHICFRRLPRNFEQESFKYQVFHTEAPCHFIGVCIQSPSGFVRKPSRTSNCLPFRPLTIGIVTYAFFVRREVLLVQVTNTLENGAMRVRPLVSLVQVFDTIFVGCSP